MLEHVTTADRKRPSRHFAGGLPWEDEDEPDHIAGVAHDFNNLLSVIMVCASEIAAGAEGAQRERAEEIREAARHGAELSRSLLGGGRAVAAAEVTVIPARLDVREALAGSRRLIERALGPEVRLALDAGAGLPPVPIATADLERVLLNLAGNAHEAMPTGGAVAIGAELVTIAPGDVRLGTGWHVRIAFADNGCGMSPDVAARALEPYFSTKDGAGSGGIGLASARSIVATAGGDLRINSRPGGGTTVAIYLPALDADGNRLALTPAGG